jgi:hypothetical protein
MHDLGKVSVFLWVFERHQIHAALSTEVPSVEPVPVLQATRYNKLNAVLYSPQSYSVADPGCLSRIRIFSIRDPGSKRFPDRIRIQEFI